jgi:ABC-2 type transport system permease protein
MNTQSSAIGETFGAQTVAPAEISAAQRLYWSVRRELWENRWIYLAPLGVAAVFLFGFFLSTVHLPATVRGLGMLDAAQQREAIARPYDIAAASMMALAILMSVFYCAEALGSERRDRSILFWKSMPVSDTTTVLAKASIPIVIVPLLASAVALGMHWIMLVESTAVLLGRGISPAPLWRELPLFQMWVLLLYHIATAHALWPAPVYCWVLLVGGWARRAALLWALLPVVIIGVLEKLIFNTSHFALLVGRRLIGDSPAMAGIPNNGFPTHPMTHITAGRFLMSPGLWLGFLVCAVFLVVAVRLRRSQGAM